MMEIGEKGLSVGTFTSSKQILCDLWLDQAASYFPYKQTISKVRNQGSTYKVLY